ncbi:MAG: integration host factor subunit beta [Treponema sp.]|jgi:integration host factor subunit beta|nr:integration host factor subunit beta [Treponema sp.]
MTGRKYTKAAIVDSIYQKTGTNRNDVRLIVDAFIDDVKGALAKNKVIELRGFGTFEIKVRKGRKRARNPRTGTILTVEPHGIASFRAGKDLKQDAWNITGKPLGKEP